MSHSCNRVTWEYGNTPKQVETNKQKAFAEINQEVIYNSDCHSGLDKNISWYDKELEDYDAAEEWIDNYTNGKWYPQVAVTYKSYESKSNAKSDRIEKKIADANAKAEKMYAEWNGFAIKNSAKNRKSAYVGCPKCGSKINKDYIEVSTYYHTMPCPICKTDLFSETVKTRLAKYEADYKELQKSITQLKKDLEVAKRGKKFTKKWLIYYEYHC